ncbi:MAG: hypothetical protein ACOH15_02675 [Acetobacterium sp.]
MDSISIGAPLDDRGLGVGLYHSIVGAGITRRQGFDLLLNVLRRLIIAPTVGRGWCVGAVSWLAILV